VQYHSSVCLRSTHLRTSCEGINDNRSSHAHLSEPGPANMLQLARPMRSLGRRTQMIASWPVFLEWGCPCCSAKHWMIACRA
jgi:hypothetical protein